MDSPLVHIIILTWNHWQATAVCLHSLAQLTYPNYQIIVVDNGSSDNTSDNIRQQFPHVTLIANEQNLGFAAGCNVGLRHAFAQGADYVLLLNNDTIASANLLDSLVQQAHTLPNVGILTPMLSYLDDPDKLWFAGSQRHPLTLEATSFGPTGPRHKRQPQLQTVDYIFGTAMFLPTAVLRRVGLFDERFFFYYEDMDLCLRVQAAGYQLYVIPQANVQHGIAASTANFSHLRAYHKARGSVLFFRKHGRYRLPLIIPYRLASTLRTLLRFARQQQWPALRAYLTGLWHGLRTPITWYNTYRFPDRNR